MIGHMAHSVVRNDLALSFSRISFPKALCPLHDGDKFFSDGFYFLSQEEKYYLVTKFRCRELFLHRNETSCVRRALVIQAAAPIIDSLRGLRPLNARSTMNPGQRFLLKPPPPSEHEAAATIQRHWRGFAVRRTRPLSQLQLIYQVRQDLKSHITALSDPAQYERLCSDPKQRLRWNECAMALLLRLDSVQGAHAHVRDIRKTVATEVIAFQEILDSTATDASSDVIRRALKSTLATFL